MDEANEAGMVDLSQPLLSKSVPSLRKNDSHHSDKFHRSKASVAMRKRGSQSDDLSNDQESDKASSEHAHPLSSVDYEWKNSRKKLLMQYFLVIWKELCERDMIKYTEQMEEKIRKDVEFG